MIRSEGKPVDLLSVAFRYAPGSPDILSDFDLSIESGVFFCLLGPSGCGKTTVLNLVAGFERPTAGAVTVGGSPVAGPGVERPVIFQGDDSLFPWLSALRNVCLGLRYTGVRRREQEAIARRAISLVGLLGHEHKYPAQLSGGMKQRIQIARAIVVSAPVLLMDEPFAALDAQVRSIMQEELARIWSVTKSTALFITHDIAEAVMLGDRVGVMSAGPSARLKEIVDVDLPRPRSISDPGFAELHGRIASLIRDEVLRTMNE